MKEELYKYLSIGLLALLLLVCFGSLITYLVVGQESINIAYAHVNGIYEDNVFPNNDCSSWTYNVVHTSSSDTTILYEDDHFRFVFGGLGSLVNNVLTSSGSTVYIRFIVKYNFAPSVYYSAALGLVSSSNFASFYADGNSGSYNSSGNYFSVTNVNGGFSANDFCNISLSNGSITLRFIYLSLNRYFYGYVPKTYENYGYNQGFTDGVNSASAPDVSGVVDLTGTTWLAPEYNVSGGTWGIYTVSGYVDSISTGSRFDFTAVSISNQPSFIDSNSTAMTLYNPPDEDMVPVVEGDLLFFTGGTDATNSTLISWLQGNNAFLSYTDGYQDGYNDGLEIGYQNGYSDAQQQAQLSLSGIYNLVGSIKTLGNISSYTFNGSTYVAYSGETDSFTDSSSVTYYANYYDTQGDDGVLLGYCVDYLFRYSVKVRTIVYGTSARWNQVGFKIIAINTEDNTYFTLSRDDTSYYKEYGSLGADNSNGTYISVEFDFEFPSADEYRLMFVPISHYVSEDTDNASMLVFEDTYFLAQGSGSMSYDDYNYLISDAYNRGMNTGRTNGYDSGREVGYNVGYTKGVEDAGNYTFNGLLGAVFDAPITMFIGKYNSETGLREGGLLNFNLLGVNLGTFVLALLSLGLVLFILRLFIRGL